MSRVGQNPTKWLKEVYQPKPVTLCTAVHIPVLEGYWEQSLSVLDECLTSMVRTAGTEAELMVLDNGSCRKVRDFLQAKQADGLIAYLLFSRQNLGKVGAWNVLLLGAPGEFIAYTDSDVLFFDGWLQQSLEIFRAFPKAGMVTGQPIAGGDVSRCWTAQAAVVDETVRTEMGRIIPEEFLLAQLKGIQADENEYARRQQNRKDVLLCREGIFAYANASHFQFLTVKKVVKQLFPAKADIPLGGDTQFDIEMQDLGYWRLCTTSYLVHHLGNRIPRLEDEMSWLTPGEFSEKHKSMGSRRASGVGVIQSPRVRQFLKWVNAKTYRLLYGT